MAWHGPSPSLGQPRPESRNLIRGAGRAPAGARSKAALRGRNPPPGRLRRPISGPRGRVDRGPEAAAERSTPREALDRSPVISPRDTSASGASGTESSLGWVLRRHSTWIATPGVGASLHRDVLSTAVHSSADHAHAALRAR
eukprot:scaffold897_cov402-Prasinococcus_capsulatus_cf.AAC.66